MKNKIQVVISIIKVAQDHVAEMKADPAKNERVEEILDDLGQGLGWLQKKLDKLNEISAVPGTRH